MSRWLAASKHDHDDNVWLGFNSRPCPSFVLRELRALIQFPGIMQFGGGGRLVGPDTEPSGACRRGWRACLRLVASGPSTARWRRRLVPGSSGVPKIHFFISSRWLQTNIFLYLSIVGRTHDPQGFCFLVGSECARLCDHGLPRMFSRRANGHVRGKPGAYPRSSHGRTFHNVQCPFIRENDS